MDKKQIAALVKKNLAKAGSPDRPAKNFGKKYSVNLKDEPGDEASLREDERQARFFKDMRKREF